MAFNIPGVIAMALFYMLILGTGLWAARKAKRVERKSQGNRTEVVLLGDRNIGLLVGVFTMTGMWVVPWDAVITDFLFYFFFILLLCEDALKGCSYYINLVMSASSS